MRRKTKPANAYERGVARVASAPARLARSLLAASLVFTSFFLHPGTAWATSMSDADNFLLENKYKDAEDAYRELLEDDTTGDAYAGLAVALAKQSWPAKILEAEKVLRQAKQKFADNPNVVASAGYVSFVHSKTVASPAKRDLYLEAAENFCSKAIKANPDILIAQQTLGLVKMAQDDNDAAIDPLKKAVSIAENPVNLTLLAQAMLKLDPKDKDAEQYINNALKLKADYYPAHLQKALVLTNDGKHEDAFMELKGIPVQSRTPDWYQVEGDIYRKQGDGPAALASWREAIRQEPHNPDAYKRLAEYYAMRGDGELAISELHSALEILPNDMPLRNKLAELALRQDKLDVAETEYRTILASQPDDPSALLGLSRVYFRKARKEGQYPPGWQQLMDQLQTVVTEQNVQGKVVKAGAKDLQENIELNEGEKALAQSHFREARQHFSQVINTHRDDPYNLLTLGEQAFNDGDLKSAEQAYTYAKEIPEVASRADQGLSKIITQRNEASRQTKLGDATRQIPEVAVDHYKQALIADPQYPNAYYGLFTLFGKGKKPDPEQADKAINYALAFLEASDEANPQRKEVEMDLDKLKKKLDKEKGKGPGKKK
jgi:tetratricopeptide (TPR) repeat protein